MHGLPIVDVGGLDLDRDPGLLEPVDGERPAEEPLSAPTDAPTTRSGRTSASVSERSIPTWAAPRLPTPQRTNAVVTLLTLFGGWLSRGLAAGQTSLRFQQCELGKVVAVEAPVPGEQPICVQQRVRPDEEL